jgi:hypothetical protein
LKNNISTITVGRVFMIHCDPKEILEEINRPNGELEKIRQDLIKKYD